jgi:hypothetical protein
LGDERSCCSRSSSCKSACCEAESRKLKATPVSCCSGLTRPWSNCACAKGWAEPRTRAVRAESIAYKIRSLADFCVLPDAARKKTAQPIRNTVTVVELERAKCLLNIEEFSKSSAALLLSQLQDRFRVPQSGMYSQVTDAVKNPLQCRSRLLLLPAIPRRASRVSTKCLTLSSDSA